VLCAAVALSGGLGTDRPVPRGLPGPGLEEDLGWLARAKPLGDAAPPWARRLYGRSLLVLRAATDPRGGAVVAGARPGWSYVWPRDGAAVALALASAGYRAEARRIARFLLRLELDAAARFYADGTPVEGREAQGDAAGWVAVAARRAGLRPRVETAPWRGRADYQEKDAGDYLANAIAHGAPPSRLRAMFGSRRGLTRRAGDPASGQEKDAGDYLANAIAHGAPPSRLRTMFGSRRGLTRRAGDPASGLDTAAAWAAAPFPRPRLFPLVRRTLLRLAAEAGRFGLLPSERWDGGEDPWTAPTAWTAWGLAALGERRAALRLMAALRRAATPGGLLPERVDTRTGAPRSTTPLAWSHAFAVLALRELWPGP
jgi:hypothetical protein